MDHLPFELKYDILYMLPYKDLLCLLSVNKNFNQIGTDEFLWKTKIFQDHKETFLPKELKTWKKFYHTRATSSLIIKDRYYPLEESKVEIISQQLNIIKEKDSEKQRLAIKMIEAVKIDTLIKLVDSTLIDDKLTKVIIYLNDYDNTCYIYSRLNKYKPLLLANNTKYRDQTINRFNINKDNRLLIICQRCDLRHANLVDKIGIEKRHMFIIPSITLERQINNIQSLFKGTLKNQTIVNFIYSQGNTDELNILKGC